MEQEIKYHKDGIIRVIVILLGLSIMLYGALLILSLVLIQKINMLSIMMGIVLIMLIYLGYMYYNIEKRNYILISDDLITIDRGFVWKYRKLIRKNIESYRIFGELLRISVINDKDVRVNLKVLSLSDINLLIDSLDS